MDTTLITLQAVQAGPMADTNLAGRVLADPAMRPRVEALLHEQRAWTTRTLAAHRHLVEALREALLERHELVGRDIDTVLEQAYGSDRPTARDTDAIDLRSTRVRVP